MYLALIIKPVITGAYSQPVRSSILQWLDLNLYNHDEAAGSSKV